MDALARVESNGGLCRRRAQLEQRHIEAPPRAVEVMPGVHHSPRDPKHLHAPFGAVDPDLHHAARHGIRLPPRDALGHRHHPPLADQRTPTLDGPHLDNHERRSSHLYLLAPSRPSRRPSWEAGSVRCGGCGGVRECRHVEPCGLEQ
eukprot:1777539-Rhodomonas_salina.1